MGFFKRKPKFDAEVLPQAAFRPDTNNELDDVVIKGFGDRKIESVRFERMSNESIWGAVYFENGDRFTFNFGAEYESVPKKRGRARIFYSLGERPTYRDFDDPRKTRTPGYGNPWGKEFGDD